MTMFCSITLKQNGEVWCCVYGKTTLACLLLGLTHSTHFILYMNKIFFYVLVVCLAGVIGNLNCSQKCVLRGDRYDSPVL